MLISVTVVWEVLGATTALHWLLVQASLVLLHFALQVLWFFYKLKLCGNPMLSKSIGTIFATAFAYFMSVCHILVILAIFQTFSLLLYLLRWSLTNDLFFNIYLFMAVLGLRFCARALSSCGKWGHSSSWCVGLSLSRPLLLRSTGSRRAGSVIVVHGPSCSAACGIFLDQGSNPCPLHWQADSQPLRHQGSPLTSDLWCYYC